jgi:hypothetical protein
MNQRIRQLAEQCRFEIQGINCEVLGQGFDEEKFADMIVRECCLQVADVRIENDFEPVGDAVLVQALAGIKKYFGVEQ